MSLCDLCDGPRVADLNAKCSDMCDVELGERSSGDHDNGYCPRDMGIGGGDYVKFSWCLDCGKVQGKFPRPTTNLERVPELDEGWDVPHEDEEDDDVP